MPLFIIYRGIADKYRKVIMHPRCSVYTPSHPFIFLATSHPKISIFIPSDPSEKTSFVVNKNVQCTMACAWTHH